MAPPRLCKLALKSLDVSANIAVVEHVFSSGRTWSKTMEQDAVLLKFLKCNINRRISTWKLYSRSFRLRRFVQKDTVFLTCVLNN